MKSAAAVTLPEIKIQKPNLLTEAELISIAKLIDPKIDFGGVRYLPKKNPVSSSSKNFKKQFDGVKKDSAKAKYTPLFGSGGGKSIPDIEEKTFKMSQYIPKGTPTKTPLNNHSTKINVSKRLKSSVMSSSFKVNSLLRKLENTEETSADHSNNLVRQQKSLNPRTGSPPFGKSKIFESCYSRLNVTPSNKSKKQVTKRPPVAKKGSLCNKPDTKNFRLEYLKEEKLSRLSESQYGLDQDEIKKSTVATLQSKVNKNKTSNVLQSPRSSPTKLQQARMQQNLMNNISVITDATNSEESSEASASLLEELAECEAKGGGATKIFAKKHMPALTSQSQQIGNPNNYIFVFGGIGEATKHSMILRYDIAQNKWEDIKTPLQVNRGGVFYDKTNQVIKVLGGKKETQFITKVYNLNPLNNDLQIEDESGIKVKRSGFGYLQTQSRAV